MQYYRCKCGSHTAWGSMTPNPCTGCEKCNTTLETHPEFHKIPRPHEFVKNIVETDYGDSELSVCRWCYRSKAEIEKLVGK